ncbi:MAG TPA: ABC transporter permease subunit [Pirellulales bacterium]|nr:ABC transporter permease subunit [Pirellulales bacterium]
MPSLTRRRKPLLIVFALGLLAALPLALGDGRTARLALNTWLLAGAVVAASVPLGTLAAMLLVRTDLPGRKLLFALLAGLLFVPLYVQVGAWQAGFGLQGWYTFAYSGPVLLDGWRGAIWVHAIAALPWVVLIVSAGLLLVERELEEQALLYGSAWQAFRHVTLRRALGSVGVAALWVAVTTSAEMTVTDYFQVRTFAEEIYVDVALGGDLAAAPLGKAFGWLPGAGETQGEGASLGVWPGVLICAWLVVAACVLVAQLLPVVRQASFGEPLVFRLGAWRGPAAAAMLVLVMLAVALPIGSLAFKAGVEVSQVGGQRVRHWSLAKCASIVADSPVRYRQEFGWSLLIASLAACAAVGAALPFAWHARRGGWRAAPALGLAALALAIPGPVVGLAVIALLNRPDIPLLRWLYDHSIAAPWLAQTWRGLPLALLTLWAGLRSVPSEVLESAALDGAGWPTTLVRIVLPMRFWAFVGAWLASFAAALAELDASVLTVPPGVDTLTIRIFNLLHYSVEDQAAGICLALFLAFEIGTIAAGRRAFRG